MRDCNSMGDSKMDTRSNCKIMTSVVKTNTKNMLKHNSDGSIFPYKEQIKYLHYPGKGGAGICVVDNVNHIIILDKPLPISHRSNIAICELYAIKDDKNMTICCLIIN